MTNLKIIFLLNNISHSVYRHHDEFVSSVSISVAQLESYHDKKNANLVFSIPVTIVVGDF